MSSWTLAKNLAHRKDDVADQWPHMDVYAIGDAAHQQEHSDHNPDARGIVHAIDVMTRGNSTAAAQILAWALRTTDDLECVIHNGRIYERDHGFASRPYTGTPNPHTDEVHLSGRHGSVGRDAETGVGYDTAAEDSTPPPLVNHKPLSRQLHHISPQTRGWDVVIVQLAIGGACGAPDGIFGPHTEAGVRAWQTGHHIGVDGIVGPITWGTLGYT